MWYLLVFTDDKEKIATCLRVQVSVKVSLTFCCSKFDKFPTDKHQTNEGLQYLDCDVQQGFPDVINVKGFARARFNWNIMKTKLETKEQKSLKLIKSSLFMGSCITYCTLTTQTKDFYLLQINPIPISKKLQINLLCMKHTNAFPQN